MAYKIKEAPRLNLIPILDAIFIFIFFLLMSAQFLDIYEIGTDAPITMDAPEDKSKKDPLNLIIELSEDKIVVKTGLDEEVKKTFKEKELLKLNEFLTELKQTNMEETSVILKPTSKYKYKKIVSVIDHVKAIKAKDKYLKVTKNSDQKLSQVLFEQVIFNTGD